MSASQKQAVLKRLAALNVQIETDLVEPGWEPPRQDESWDDPAERLTDAELQNLQYNIFKEPLLGDDDEVVLAKRIEQGVAAAALAEQSGSSAPTLVRDLFIGTRLALNDFSGTQLLAGAVVDLNDGSLAARIEGERRLTNRLKVELEGRFFLNVAESNFLWLFERDSFFNLRLAYSF